MEDKRTTSVMPAPQFPPFPSSLGMPVGSVIAFAGELRLSPDDLKEHKTNLFMFDWLLCDGQSVKISEFPVLFSALGFLYGGNQKSGRFQLPNYKGTFLRGVDDSNSTQYPGSLEKRTTPGNGSKNSVGSTQNYALKTHQHNYKYRQVGAITPADPPKATFLNAINSSEETTGLLDVDVSNQSNIEIRPVNTFVYWLIKAKPDAVL
ncbi:phage tail protein [Marinomonas sp.]|uniref:phage tail protein n=1 Tax=Marinomonas sp. TaxID=1904862 RepID=UPI003BA9A9E2